MSDKDNWHKHHNKYISRQIIITNNMRTVSRGEICNREEETKEIFTIRIHIDEFYYHHFQRHGYIDQTKLCVVIESSTPNNFCIGDTINLANNDSINRGKIKNGQVHYENDVECMFPVAVNILFKKMDCKFFTFGDVQCNPLLLTVCKIC